VCMYFSTEATPDIHNDLIGIVSYSDKNKNYENRNYVKRQYIEMKDKDGDEIYEGDILTVWCGGVEQKIPYVVADLRDFYHECKRDDYYMIITDSLIIGNIYENPELLLANESEEGKVND
jgi:hypothetical protein